ncbi:MAG: hypothetical protein DMG74_18330 [Acidobacteria bacterium]|nr:MAG: hypothetical protein DMG74_18330 [Acidobacteriota bacterium]
MVLDGSSEGRGLARKAWSTHPLSVPLLRRPIFQRGQVMATVVALIVVIALTGGCACVIPVAATSLSIASLVIAHDPSLAVVVLTSPDTDMGVCVQALRVRQLAH